MIKTSNHSIKNSNSEKLRLVSDFVDEYRRCASIVVNEIWSNGYEYSINETDYKFDVKNNQLDTPKYIDYKHFNLNTTLTARALSSLVTQIAGILKASVEKQRKRIYILEKTKGENKKPSGQLIKKIKQNIPQKPSVESINPELSSKCAKFEYSDKSFDGFLTLSAIFKDQRSIHLPIRMHRHSRKLSENGVMKGSFLIKKESVDFRWEISEPEKKKEGKIVGADQGAKTVLTLSDEQTTVKDIHGHDLDSIMKKMVRLKPGSKAFRRAQDHRKNYINWAINQIDLSEIKQINLEKIWNIGYKNGRSRFLSHFTNTLIRDKIEDFATIHGVHVIEQISTYRSQRCSGCGVVRKANRKGKNYECKHCGNLLDADLNAALNHSVILPEVPYTLRNRNLNRGNGFFWKEEGFFDFEGRSLESLPPVEDI